MRHTVCMAASALVLAAAVARAAAPHRTLFQLGTPDGVSREFGGTRRLWPHYRQVFPKPIVFTVGQSKLSEWPYIHPSNMDTWAGGMPHTFTIRFGVKALDERPLFLVLGLADTCANRPPLVTVAFNGQALPPRRAPTGNGRGAFDPSAWVSPSHMVFQAPKGALRTGSNVLTIHCETKSWIIYDYVRLGTDPAPAKIAGESDALLEEALAGPLKDVEDIVFAVRQPGRDGHWYANFGYYAPDDKRLLYGNGGMLRRLNLRTGKATDLLDDATGGVRDPQVHYDGTKVLFSYRRGGSPHYLLHEINADGSGLRQLTHGPYDDIEPTYVPDGGIMFCSSRCHRWVNCWLTQVAVLYRCDADGRNIQMLSSNNEHDNTPWPLPDGRVLYTRWEYVDRSQVHYHHLWTANPDGTGQMVYYGNQNGGITMIDAKPIAGTQKVLAIFSPGHGRREHNGVVTVIDPNAGPDTRPFARGISRGADFRDPYPLSADCFLVVRQHDILLMNGRGIVQRIYTLSEKERRAGLQVHEPRPLAPRPRERRIPARVRPTRQTGRLVLVNANFGRNMGGVRPGEIKKLLVLETLPKPINFTGGMEPLSYGGTFTLERVLGTVPVEPDGSAYMELPALRSLFFVALDDRDLSVKRMQSFLTVMPGETTSCAGCHENRTDTPPPTAALMALQRPPSRIEPIPDVPDVMDFPRDIQPILRRHCVPCHGYDKTERGGPRSGGVILTGDRGPMFSHSYYMLTVRLQIADGRNRARSNYPPRAIGSSASPLMHKILKGHHGVKLSDRERTIVRLWIDSGAPYPGTYAALGTGMVGGYAQNRLDRSDTKWPSMKAAMEVRHLRCGQCHKGRLLLPTSPTDNMGMPPWAIHYGHPRLRFSRHILYNLTRPDKSLLLLAPLAASAGGYGICKHRDAAQPNSVFQDTRDPGYQMLLAAVHDTKKRLDTIKRFDMPGFRPCPAWVREMQRYGILPSSLPAAAPIDAYAVERAYWKSLWYRPLSPQAMHP